MVYMYFNIEIGGHVSGKRIAPKTETFYIEFEKIFKTFAGGEEKPYGSTDFTNKTSVVTGYHQYDRNLYRKLEIKKLSIAKENSANSINTEPDAPQLHQKD